MKKKLLATAAIITLSVTGYYVAEAHSAGWGPGMGPGYGQGPCAAYTEDRQQLSEEEQKARDQFYEENTQLRKKIFEKRTELSAVMNSDAPDEKKAAALSGELFDLREEMHRKAQESGMKAGYGVNCNGPYGGNGMGYGGGPRHRGWGW